MKSINFVIIFVPVLSLILIAVNFILAAHSPYKEKKTPFECGYHSFFQTRSPFNIMFFIFGLVFIVLDLEIVLIYPLPLSSGHINIYGIITAGIFVIIVTLGFGYEIGKGALNIDSKQNNLDSHLNNNKSAFLHIMFLNSLDTCNIDKYSAQYGLYQFR